MTAPTAATGLATAIVDRLRAMGRQPAFVCDDRTLDGETLAARIEAEAAIRVAPEMSSPILAVDLENDTEIVIRFLAGVRAGRTVAAFDPSWSKGRRDELLTALCAQPDAGVFLRRPLPEENPDGDFYIGFTSGSSGLPKGFRRSGRSWILSIEAANAAFGLSALDTVIALGNLAHSLFLFAVLHGLHLGATTRMAHRFRPDRALDMLLGESRAVVYATPTHLQALIDVARRAGASAPGVRMVLTAGAALSTETATAVAEVFPNARVHDFYGASELSFVTYATVGETPAGSVGRPFRGVTVDILDDTGRPCPVGTVGNVFVTSPFLFSGYAPEGPYPPKRHGQAVSAGDLGWLDEAGNLYLRGRSERMIVSGARKIYPERIEAILSAHPAVRRAAVIGIDDATRGQRLVGVIEPVDGAKAHGRDLARWCRNRLDGDEVPSRFLRVYEWPVTAAGKIDLPALTRAVAGGAGEPLP